MATKKASTEVEAAKAEMKRLDFTPTNWDEVASAFDGEVIEFEGSPYTVTDKSELIGVPFMIADIRFNDSGSFGEFCSIALLTQENDRLVINDGSSGIFKQVQELVNRTGRVGGIIVRNGLRVSEYEYQPTDFDGEPAGKAIPAKTYYLA